jgi:hypothetical protein
MAQFNAEDLVPKDFPVNRERLATLEAINKAGIFMVLALIRAWRKEAKTCKKAIKEIGVFRQKVVEDMTLTHDVRTMLGVAEVPGWSTMPMVLEKKFEERKAEKRAIEQKIGFLAHLTITEGRKARPLPAQLRHSQWFSVGDPIVFAKPDGPPVHVDVEDIAGTAIYLRPRVETPDTLLHDPRLMHRWEYYFLDERPYFLDFWLSMTRPLDEQTEEEIRSAIEWNDPC